MTLRIDFQTVEGSDRPRVLYDGEEPSGQRPDLRWQDIEGMPFPAVYINDERQYDVEIWMDGNLRHKVPPRSPAVDAAYERIEQWEPQTHSVYEGGSEAFDAGAFSTLDQLRREIEQHPGQIAYLNWVGLQRMVAVHDANAEELGGLLEAILTSDDIAIEMFQNVRPPEVRHRVEGRIDQRLHNYLASAKALIDHTRRVLNTYGGSHLAKEYETRKDAVASTPASIFVNNLRNYTLHRQLPFVGHTVSFGEQGRNLRTEIQLSCADLLKWKGWSAPARRLLQSAGDSVNLRDIIAEHIALVRTLYTWVLAQFEGLHRNELAELEEIRTEFSWVLSGGREGRPRSR